MSATPPKRQRPPVPRSLLKLIAAIVVAGVLVTVALLPFVGTAGAAANVAADQFLDTSCDITNWSVPQPTQILARDGKTVIARLFNQNRKDIPLSAVPLSVREALISTEDRRFYSHHGVDLRGLLRAAVNNTSGSDTQGGSTLTMQYVKQLRYYQASTDAEKKAAIAQDLHRKIQDAQCAIQIEKQLSKDEILQNYLNIAFFGENSYGIQIAAETYFGVDASKLTVEQSATLVGLLQSPTAYDPFQHPQAAINRRNQVLRNMVDTGALSAADAAAAEKMPLQLATTQPPDVAEGCAYATNIPNDGFFCDYAVQWLADHAGMSLQKLQNGGYTVVTTLDPGLQAAGQNAVFQTGLAATSPTTLVMPSVNSQTGEVTSMITSKHYGLDESQGQTDYPIFTDGYAGAGSTYKYFTTLAAMALGVQPDFALSTPGGQYTTKNCKADPNDTSYKPFVVHNVGTYATTLPLQLALPESVNTYFVALEDQFFGCNLAPIVSTALDLGMNQLKQPQENEPSKTIAQATVSERQAGFTLGFAPTSALEISGAYATIAHDGIFCPPHPILSVSDASGNKLPIKQPACRQVIDPQIAHTMVNIMTQDTTQSFGTAGRFFTDWYARGGSQVASKTGTDNDVNDTEKGGNSALWFIGVTPNLTSAAALVNYQHPKDAINSANLPANAPSVSGDIFGAYASTFWQAAYGPVLLQQHWSWPGPYDVANGIGVPSVTALPPQAASGIVTAAGFKPQVASIQCGSGLPAGMVGYYAPRVAPRGATITLCLSNGQAPIAFPVATPDQTGTSPPPVTQRPTRRRTGG